MPAGCESFSTTPILINSEKLLNVVRLIALSSSNIKGISAKRQNLRIRPIRITNKSKSSICFFDEECFIIKSKIPKKVLLKNLLGSESIK